ncbi:MAG: efflux RND transporter periplasmic adaptor subunit [Lutibacter sp.]|jgi:cobalt-zinc-cadmium efflux system membrane fusion protein
MKKYIINTIYILSIFTIISCDNSKNPEKEAVVVDKNLIEITEAQFQSSAMELGEIMPQNFSEGIKTNGFIDVPPSDRAMVSAIMGGYVKVSHLLIGAKVKKGELLLTLENPNFIEIQQNYLEIHERLNYLKNEYERQKTLFNEKITSEKNYLKAESDYKSSLANYNGLAQKLRLMNINTANVKIGNFTSSIPVYSPINGSIAQVYASVGKFMNESDVLLEIIDDTHKHLELVIFEKDVLKVKVGQPIKFKLPESSEVSYDAEVHLIGTSIDVKNRTVMVHGHMEKELHSFLVGMFVEAEIVTNSTQKTALPSAAILEEDGKSYILVLKEKIENNYNFEKIQIAIGTKNEDFAEIINIPELLKNKQILIKGAFLPIEE